MGVTTFIALRYMQAGRNNRFFSWISALTMMGVAIGVAALIVVWSVVNGFESELRKRFLAANAHVMVYRFPHGLSNPDQWAKVLTTDFKSVVKGASPFIHYETMARKNSILHAVLIRGINPHKRANVQNLDIITRPKESLEILQQEITGFEKTKTVPKIPSVIIGSGLLSLLDAQVGDTIELVEPDNKNLASMKSFKIVGIYDSGLKHYDNKLILMSIPVAQDFFQMDTRVTGFELGLYKPWDSPAIAEAMGKKYSISIREWQSFNKPLFEAMQTERVVILVITGLVAAVAGFNILTTIFVAVSQRQRDISILKALGASHHLILSLFLKQGVYIGVVGSLLGMFLAFCISKVLERYQFVDLPDLYLLAKLPMTYEWSVYGVVSLVSIAIAILAGLYPAWTASRVDPVEGFRGNQGP